jgi:hypothetical protein
VPVEEVGGGFLKYGEIADEHPGESQEVQIVDTRYQAGEIDQNEDGYESRVSPRPSPCFMLVFVFFFLMNDGGWGGFGRPITPALICFSGSTAAACEFPL